MGLHIDSFASIQRTKNIVPRWLHQDDAIQVITNERTKRWMAEQDALFVISSLRQLFGRRDSYFRVFGVDFTQVSNKIQ